MSKSKRSHSLHKWLSAVLQVAILFGLIIALYERYWLNVFLISGILLLTFLPTFVSRRLAVFIPPEFEMATIVFIFASLFLGEIRGYYLKFWWWDIILHSSSAFLLGILGFLLVYVLNQSEKIDLYMKPIFMAMFSFAFAVSVGVLWEIFEYAMDRVFALKMQKGLVDTMWDLIVDTAGALVISLIGYVYMQRGEKSFIESHITRFIESNPNLFLRR